MRVGPFLNMIFTDKEDTVEDVKIGESFGCTHWEIVEFRIQRKGNKARNRITALDLSLLYFASRSNFVLFRNLLGRLPPKIDVDRTGIQESWLFSRITSKLKNILSICPRNQGCSRSSTKLKKKKKKKEGQTDKKKMLRNYPSMWG